MRAEPEPIFHIATAREWEAATDVGSYRVSTLGRTLDDIGFIHCSFRRQVERIGSLVYGSVPDPLVLLEIDVGLLSAALRIESLDGGDDLFPHIYGPLPTAAVSAVLPARIVDRRLVVDWPGA